MWMSLTHETLYLQVGLDEFRDSVSRHRRAELRE